MLENLGNVFCRFRQDCKSVWSGCRIEVARVDVWRERVQCRAGRMSILLLKSSSYEASRSRCVLFSVLVDGSLCIVAEIGPANHNLAVPLIVGSDVLSSLLLSNILSMFLQRWRHTVPSIHHAMSAPASGTMHIHRHDVHTLYATRHLCIQYDTLTSRKTDRLAPGVVRGSRTASSRLLYAHAELYGKKMVPAMEGSERRW